MHASSPPEPRALIFDYDGLIVDSERHTAETFIEVMAGVGGTVALEEIGHLFGSTEADHLWDELIQARCDRTVEEIVALMTPLVRAGHDALPLLPGVRELLDRARDRGLKIGLATGQDLDRLPGRLSRLEIHDDFDAIVTAEEGRGASPTRTSSSRPPAGSACDPASASSWRTPCRAARGRSRRGCR